MAKLRKLSTGYIISCPACESPHYFPTEPNKQDGIPEPVWRFRGTPDLPTFEPPMFARTTRFRCHFRVMEGMIEFLRGCTHAMTGQIIELPDFED